MRPLFVYDTAIHPLTFDLVLALVHCKILSINEVGRAEFDVLFWNKGSRRVGIEGTHSADDQLRRTVNIVPQLLCNFRPCRNKFLIDDPTGATVERVATGYTTVFYNKTPVANPLFTFRGLEITLAANPGVVSSVVENNWACSSEAVRRDKEIVLHVRCSRFSPERNTPPAQFFKLFDILKRIGFDLSLVPDVEGLTAESPWHDWPGKMYAVAANNIYERMSVALGARLNIVWGGGICAPILYSDAPYLFTGFFNRGHALCTLEYFARKGPVPFSLPPFLKEHQWWDWTEVSELSLESLVTSIEKVLNR